MTDNNVNQQNLDNTSNNTNNNIISTDKTLQYEQNLMILPKQAEANAPEDNSKNVDDDNPPLAPNNWTSGTRSTYKSKRPGYYPDQGIPGCINWCFGCCIGTCANFCCAFLCCSQY
ncbi:11648_t:CDS:2 [Ambispora leptoticha]|uniref:11648_t:CDS:1 n=1 Tax=Ambispora leptoticha TaxID=144679 RepID=A0A9N9APT0_9GLOM|nr:11648_t:CDS:2 [Ambispora leptoticha]